MHAPEPPQPALAPVVILNPAGNRGRAGRLRRPLERALRGGRGELILTQSAAETELSAMKAAAAGRPVVAVGGDGTIALVANGVLASGVRVPLGIVPAGSGNDYACQTLKLPRDPLAALAVALGGEALPMDVGQVNGRYFFNSLGVGIDANIAAAAEDLKRFPLMRGQALYWASSLRELLLHYDRCPELTIAVDGQPAASRLYALAAISIGPTYGGGFQINPGADPHDGYFDVCLIWKPALLRALRLLPLIEKGRHLDQPEVTRYRARTVTLASRTPIHAHLDGEVITASAFEVSILPGALLVRQRHA